MFTKRKLNGRYAKKDDKQMLVILGILQAFTIVLLAIGIPKYIAMYKTLGNINYTQVIYQSPQSQQEELEEYAREQAKMLGIDEDKFVTLIACESSWNPSARNKESSARGLLQYLVGTWETTQSNRQGYSRFDPYASIREAVIDIANGSQSMWQECLDITGINFYE